MKRISVCLYGLVCYVGFLATLLYLVGFVTDFLVPKSIDSGPVGPVGEAVAVNLLLLALFGLQHTIMARPAFKKTWTRLVPRPIERSTYVLLTNLLLILLFWQWRPIGGLVWDVQDPVGRVALLSLGTCGWLLVLVSTFLINHFDLFGLRQVWVHLRGRTYRPLDFTTPGPYKIVRHPLYVGWQLAFWATPTMTTGHLLFAGAMTVYILIAIQFEERNLVAFHPEYAEYRRRVPALVPMPRRLVARPEPDAAAAADPITLSKG